MSTSITSSITAEQEKQYRRFVEDATGRGCGLALRQVPLDKDGLQKLISRGDEFNAAIARAIVDATRELSLSNQFANEEAKSKLTYPKEYKGPKPIEDQIKAIAEMFDLMPDLALEYAENLPALPNGAEGWFAIPNVAVLAAKYFPKWVDPAEQYCRAIQLIHEKIAASRPFYNYREGQIAPQQLRMTARTMEAMKHIAETQKGEIFIIAAQLGMRHRGRSVRRAREVFVANEFGLGSVAVGSIILTHPERLVRWEELDMDCAGDEFAPDADGQFVKTPFFFFYDGKVEFDTYGVDNFYDRYGSASRLLPQ